MASVGTLGETDALALQVISYEMIRLLQCTKRCRVVIRTICRDQRIPPS